MWKPSTGDPAGSWGTKVAANFDELDQKALNRDGDSMNGTLDMGVQIIKQGPFETKYNQTTGEFEIYFNTVRIVVFDSEGNFRIKGQMREGENL